MYESTNPEIFKEKNGYVIQDAWFPRVTSILSIKAKPALYRFYAELDNFAQGEDIKTKSADEGTRVHEAVEAILTGKEAVIGDDIRPSIDAFEKFMSEKNIQVDPEWVERRIVNFSERYAGTVDALALIDGKFGVMDIKTSQGIYRDYNLQVGAYFPPLKEEFRNLQTRWILRIDQAHVCMNCGATKRVKGGREKIKRAYPGNGVNFNNCDHEWSDVRGVVELREFPYWQDDYHAFLGAKKLWEWEHQGILKKIGYV